jgi:hypothetical protein
MTNRKEKQQQQRRQYITESFTVSGGMNGTEHAIIAATTTHTNTYSRKNENFRTKHAGNNSDKST